MTEKNICDKIFEIINNEFNLFAYNGYEILMIRQDTYYVLSSPDIVTKPRQNNGTTIKDVFSMNFPYLVFEYTDMLFNQKKDDLSWNKISLKLNLDIESFDLRYYFDDVLFQKSKKDLEKVNKRDLWRWKFDYGKYAEPIYKELLSRGIDDNLADFFFCGTIQTFAVSIQEIWQKADLTIERSTAQFKGNYTDNEGIYKKFIFDDLKYTHDFHPNNQSNTVDNYAIFDKKLGFKWSKVRFDITFEGDFNIEFTVTI